MQPGQISQYFSDRRALLPYSLLGIAAGLLSAGAVLCFEWTIEALGWLWLGENSPDGFETLTPAERFTMPLLAALALGLVYSWLKPDDRETGIVHVLSRMHSHYGHLPLKNALVQFSCGALALASGHSGGREGPGVHLGAAMSSGLCSVLGLPNNSRRILIACGTAGSIAAAFDTPLAGVVFAMEVIVAEYTVVGFTPVLVAAISATTLSHALRGGGLPDFVVPGIPLTSLLELPLILLIGMAAGAAAGLFSWLLKLLLRLGKYPVLLRFGAVGVLTGGLGVLVPGVMGMGYDSLGLTLLGEMAPLALALLLLTKLAATAWSVGLGLPVGVIGPSLLIGGCVGGLLGLVAEAVLPGFPSDISLYVVIGMGAGMAAMLNAPLAALLAVVELTGSVSVVFPTMLAIVAATLTVTVGFRARSVHQTVLRHLEREIPEDPISQLLHQTNVMTAMDRNVCVLNHGIGPGDYPGDLNPNWCLLKREGEHLVLVRGADAQPLAEQLQEEERIDLLEQDIRRWTMTPLSQRATLREALDAMRKSDVEAVVVMDSRIPGDLGVRGVLTRDIIDQFYLMKL